MEGSVRVPESSVTVKQWVSIRILRYSIVKITEYKVIVVEIYNCVGYNVSVIQVQNRTKINLVLHRRCPSVAKLLQILRKNSKIKMWFKNFCLDITEDIK